MRLRPSTITLAVALLSIGCEGSPGADGADAGEPCPAAVDGVSPTYAVALLGFPGVVDDMVVDPGAGFEFEGTCTVTQVSFAADQLELALACEHPDTDDAIVTLTAAATGIPEGLSVGANLSVSVEAIGNAGGDASGGGFRSLSNVIIERHVIADEAGLVFAALRGGLGGSFDSVTVEEQYNCPGWSPCSADGDISGTILASSGTGSVDVAIGEVGLLEDGELAWDVSLFQARLGGCHGNYGEFSLIRRP